MAYLSYDPVDFHKNIIEQNLAEAHILALKNAAETTEEKINKINKEIMGLQKKAAWYRQEAQHRWTAIGRRMAADKAAAIDKEIALLEEDKKKKANKEAVGLEEFFPGCR